MQGCPSIEIVLRIDIGLTPAPAWAEIKGQLASTEESMDFKIF